VTSVVIGASYEESKRVVVFDFGGVVGGSHRGLLEEKLAAELKISHEKVVKMIEAYERAKRLNVSEKRFWHFYSVNSGIWLPSNWPSRFEEIKRHIVSLNPEMMKLVDELKEMGHRVAMLSNVTTKRSITIREKGFYNYFDPAVLSCEIGCAKPDKRSYTTLLKRLGNPPPGHCIFIDDKQANVDAALDMGIDAIRFTSCDDLKLELCKRKVFVKLY